MTFKPGTVVVFDYTSFNLDYWNSLGLAEKLAYYGSLHEKNTLNPRHWKDWEPTRFVFLCEVEQAPGHCVLVSISDGHIETMRHTDNFRALTEEEL